MAHGNWERVARGVFRLRDYPLPDREDLIVLSLLSHNRAGEPQAVVSHETALALHDLSDANPARIHLTVPPAFRRQLRSCIVIHRSTIPAEDWEECEGYRVTTPLRTLLDIAESPTGWPYLVAVCEMRFVGDSCAAGSCWRHLSRRKSMIGLLRAPRRPQRRQESE